MTGLKLKNAQEKLENWKTRIMWNIKKLEKQKTGKLEYQKTRTKKLEKWKTRKLVNQKTRKIVLNKKVYFSAKNDRK